jgi:hypothetical protein
VFARSSTFTGDPSHLDDGVTFVRDDVMRRLDAIEGCVGVSMLVDRDGGSCIVTTSWVSEEAMRASEESLRSVRGQLARILDTPASVEEWEIAAMHRDHATLMGSCCRVTWFRTDHADVDRGIDIYRHAVLPRLEEIEGFCSASLMVDRSRSRACSTVCYDSVASLEASRDQSWAIRDAGVRDAGVDIIDAGEYELVLAHLRVPVTA